MSIHTATVTWTCTGDFCARTYSRGHTWSFDGGAVIAASASPHNVPLPYAIASAVDPEEGLIAAVSSCHMLWFLDFSSRAGFVIARYEDRAEGVMGRNDQGRTAFTRITLKPEIIFTGKRPTAEQLRELHDAAHESCYVGNSLRAEIVIAI